MIFVLMYFENGRKQNIRNPKLNHILCVILDELIIYHLQLHIYFYKNWYLYIYNYAECKKNV